MNNPTVKKLLRNMVRTLELAMIEDCDQRPGRNQELTKAWDTYGIAEKELFAELNKLEAEVKTLRNFGVNADERIEAFSAIAISAGADWMHRAQTAEGKLKQIALIIEQNSAGRDNGNTGAVASPNTAPVPAEPHGPA